MDYNDRFEYPSAVNFEDTPYRDLHLRISTEFLKEDAIIFEKNLDRVRAGGALPLILAFFSNLHGEAFGRACSMTILPSLEQQELKDKFDKKMQRFYKRRIGISSENDMIRRTRRGGNEMLKWIMEESKGVGTEDGIQATFGSMIIGAWGAFEALASDIWIKSVNSRPLTLGKQAATKPTFIEATDGATERKNNQQERSLTMKELADSGFDVSSKIGTILRRKGVVNFDLFHNIIRAYELIFDKKIRSAFDKEPDLQVVSLVRNLLAHRAGIIDNKFIEKLPNGNSELRLSVGSRIVLTGPMVCSYIDSLVLCSTELLRFVDDWLKVNPR